MKNRTNDRKEKLIEMIGGNILYIPLIEEIITLEMKLDELSNTPMYKINPKNPMQQKILPAHKMYKELLQQYTNCIKTLERNVGNDNEDGESPLRKWLNERNNKGKKDMDTR